MPRALDTESGVPLEEYGIDPVQAAEIRDSLASFAEEWEQPEMDIYDDYDVAKASLEANRGAKF